MESQTISLLKDAGESGLLLTELAQRLEQPATDVLKIIEILTRNGHIKKVEEQHDGNTVLRFFWQEADDAEWDTLEGCPCFSCAEIDQCGAGHPTSPWNCNKLNTWIDERIG